MLIKSAHSQQCLTYLHSATYHICYTPLLTNPNAMLLLFIVTCCRCLLWHFRNTLSLSPSMSVRPLPLIVSTLHATTGVKTCAERRISA